MNIQVSSASSQYFVTQSLHDGALSTRQNSNISKSFEIHGTMKRLDYKTVDIWMDAVFQLKKVPAS